VDHVEAEQRGNPVPIALDHEPLQAIGLRRVGDEQQGAGLAAADRLLDHLRLTGQAQLVGCVNVGLGHATEVEVLGELPGLLRRRHVGDQLVDPGSDRGVGGRLRVGHVAPHRGSTAG